MNILKELYYMVRNEEVPVTIGEVVDACWGKERKPQMHKILH